MRFLLCQDLHLTSRQPVSRVGCYSQTQLSKLEKMFNVARTRKVDCIVINGDLVDKNDMDLNFIAEVLYVFLANKDVRVILNPGNHCLVGYNLDSIHQGIVGIFLKLKLIELFDNNAYPSLKAIPFTSKLPSKFLFLDNIKTQKKILLIHNMLLPEGNYPFEYMPIEKFETDASMVLLSHWHHPFHKKVGNTNFVNIGSFGRLKTDERDIMPSVAIVDTNGSFELVELGEKGEKVFKERVEQDEVSKFVAELPKQEFSFETVYEVLSKLEIEKSIKDECYSRLDIAERSLV